MRKEIRILRNTLAISALNPFVCAKVCNSILEFSDEEKVQCLF